jgi:hypothetical protein
MREKKLEILRHKTKGVTFFCYLKYHGLCVYWVSDISAACETCGIHFKGWTEKFDYKTDYQNVQVLVNKNIFDYLRDLTTFYLNEKVSTFNF